MSDLNKPPSPTPNNRRRSSFAGQTFADLFGTGRTKSSEKVTSNPTNPNPGPITSAAAQASQRRMSMNTLGLSSSPTFNGFRRRDSIGSTNSGSIDESAIEEDASMGQNGPASPFARRMSFGARALRDVKNNSSGGADKSNGRSPPAEQQQQQGAGKKTRIADPAPTSSPRSRDGYNWADNFRNRAERTASIGSYSSSPPQNHMRAKSMAAVPTVQQEPVAPKQHNVPDHFQERILKGDFYMD